MKIYPSVNDQKQVFLICFSWLISKGHIFLVVMPTSDNFIYPSQLKIQGEKTGRKGHLSVVTEVNNSQVFLFWYSRDQVKFNLEKYIVPHKCMNNSWWFWFYWSVSIDSKDDVLTSIFQVFEVAPSLCMVEIRKAGGDTLEFHKVRFW